MADVTQMVEPYPKETRLFALALILATVFWVGLALLLKSAIERYAPGVRFQYVGPGLVLLLTVSYLLIAQLRKARRIAYLRGNAVEIGPNQHPDLYIRLKSTCKRLGIEALPTAYLFQNPEITDCFSVRFQNASFLALNGEVVGALTDRQGAIDFVMGHELGRITDRRAGWLPFIFPALVLPLLGPAYARAKVYSYDRYGIAACKTKVDAAFALAVVASGSRRWKSFNIPQFASQSATASHFWMSLDELNSPVPWLSKRMAHLRAIATDSDSFIPRRHPLAYLVALFVPYIGPRVWNGLLRLTFVGLWVAVAAYAGALGYERAREAGIIQQLGNRLQVLVKQQPAAPAPASVPEASNPYALLDADLRRLGAIARERQRVEGGIPCEIDRRAPLKLNFRWERYAFSCDEPVVYTVIERGEFESGRPSYVRKFNWKEGRFVTGAAGP
jgi:Zn-dependent protease with chaperone function